MIVLVTKPIQRYLRPLEHSKDNCSNNWQIESPYANSNWLW